MKVSLLGLPASGKSLILETLTGTKNTGLKEENMYSIKVPDERIEYLKNIYNPKKSTLAEIVLIDYNIQNDKKEVIASKIKNLIQKSDILLFILRNFNTFLTDSPLDPALEYAKLKDEIILTDCLTIEKRLERESRERKNTPDINVIKKILTILESNKFPKESDFSAEDLKQIANYNFLSLKKIIAIVNQEEGKSEIPTALADIFKKDNISYFSISAVIENELNTIPPADRGVFLQEYGLSESANTRMIKHIYKELGYISFLTTGEDEVRAWPIKSGLNAWQAAGKIHSDIEKGFIRAEVIGYDDFIKYNSEAECKKAGKFRLEGKEYIVKDGDIINFRFNL